MIRITEATCRYRIEDFEEQPEHQSPLRKYRFEVEKQVDTSWHLTRVVLLAAYIQLIDTSKT